VYAMLESLSKVEREVYDLILRTGEVMVGDIPSKKAGAIPSLVNKGLVEIEKRKINHQTTKKSKFVRIRGTE
jgi:hypothetical protein